MRQFPSETNRDSPSRPLMPVVVTESFEIRPGSESSVDDICTAIRLSALRNPACLSLRVLHDRRDAGRVTILSEWQSAESFNTFIRNSGVLWLERGAQPPLASTWAMLYPQDRDQPTTDSRRRSDSSNLEADRAAVETVWPEKRDSLGDRPGTIGASQRRASPGRVLRTFPGTRDLGRKEQ